MHIVSQTMGLRLWNYSKTLKSKMFSSFIIAYSTAFKRIIGAPSYSSSHEAAEACWELLLPHHLALTQARLYHRLSQSSTSLTKPIFIYLYGGLFCTHTSNLSRNKYTVSVS